MCVCVWRVGTLVVLQGSVCVCGGVGTLVVLQGSVCVFGGVGGGGYPCSSTRKLVVLLLPLKQELRK